MTAIRPSVTPHEPVDTPIDRLAEHVLAGGLAILPTDTVYGIGALAGDAQAVARLQAAKGRGRQMPPPVLVASPQQAAQVVTTPPAAQILMNAFWPGALTIILPAVPGLDWDLGDTGGTVAVRMPDHDLALALLRATGPMAVTSANLTGEPPATDAAAARAAFPGRVGNAVGASGEAGPTGTGPDILLLDGGPTPGPVPSTIISLADPNEPAALVRAGVVPADGLEAVLGRSVSGQRGGRGGRDA